MVNELLAKVPVPASSTAKVAVRPRAESWETTTPVGSGGRPTSEFWTVAVGDQRDQPCTLSARTR